MGEIELEHLAEANLRTTALASAAALSLALVDAVEWADEFRFAYAWMTTGEHWDVLPDEKLTRGVVGLHFAQTDPEVIRYFLGTRQLKVVNESAGVFHPKVLVALKGESVRAIIGSSNATRGGFSTNVELNVLLEGQRGSTAIDKIIEFVDAQWENPSAWFADAAWLERYEQSWKVAQRGRAKIKVPDPSFVGAQVAQLEDLDVGWADYFDLIRAQRFRESPWGPLRVFDETDSYLWEMRQASRAFEEYPLFSEIPEELRKTVAGFGSSSGSFGSMEGAGSFKNMVIERPAVIGAHLDAVPLRGPVPPEALRNYLDGLTSLHGIALSTATRLLAMKRPDTFLPINNGNRPQIRRLFGSAPGQTSTYLMMHQRIWAFPWYSAPEPEGAGLESEAWGARVALLDACIYVHPE